jgi:methanogenic corrinoid protein MtbC1
MLDRKTLMIYVVLGSIGAILLVAIFGSFAGVAMVGEYARFQVAFMGKFLKFTVNNADKVLSITQNTVTSIGKTSLATISVTASTIAAIQKTLFELTFFVASQTGIIVAGAVTTVKEALELLTRMAEKVVSMVATFAKTSIDIVSRAMKATTRMIGKTVDSVNKFATEVFVPALRKTFKLTQEMAENITKIMTKILPLYMEVLKRGMQVVLGGEVFSVGLYAISAYMSMNIYFGAAFVKRIFGTNVVELIINALKGIFTEVLVGTLNPFSLCSVVTELVKPALSPVVAPNIPIFGSTLKKCDTELIKLGLFIATKGRLCGVIPSVISEAITCMLGRVGNIQIIPSVPRIEFSASRLLGLIGLPSEILRYVSVPSLGIGGFGPFTINRLLQGVFDALTDYLEMAMRRFTREMSSLAGSFGTAYKSVSFSIVNPKQSGALRNQAVEQTRALESDQSSLISSLTPLTSFPQKFPELDSLYSTAILPILQEMVKRVRLLGNTVLLNFEAYRILYVAILPSLLTGALSGNNITMNDHGYDLGDEVFIQTSGGFVRRRITNIVSRNGFKIDLTDVVQTPQILEAPHQNTTEEVGINIIESFLLRVIQKKYFARFFKEEDTSLTTKLTGIVKLSEDFYGISSSGKVWRNNSEDLLSPTKSLIIFAGTVYAATDTGVYFRNSFNEWPLALPNVKARALEVLDANRLLVGSEGRLDVLTPGASPQLITNDIDGDINSIVFDPDSQTVYVAGEFGRINDITMNLVAGYRLTDGTWFSLRSGINEPGSGAGAEKIILFDGRLVVYGDFAPLYIYDISRDIWTRITPPSKIISHVLLNDGVLLLGLQSGRLSFLFPGSNSLTSSGVEVSEMGSLFQDGELIYIQGTKRINVNKIRLSIPTITGTITSAPGGFSTSMRLFPGTVLTIGSFRTRVVAVSPGGIVTLEQTPPTTLVNARFSGRIPSILDEITLVYFANALAEYVLADRSRPVSGTLTISGTVTTTSNIVVGTVLSVNGFRTKVIGVTVTNNTSTVILSPPLPTSLSGSQNFTGSIPTILSIVNSILQQNTRNSFISDASERALTSTTLEQLYNDFIDFTSTIPNRYLVLENLAPQNVLVANFIVSVPEYTLLKYRAGKVQENQTTASIVTMLSVIFRQMIVVIIKKIKDEILNEARSRVDSVVRRLPNVSTPSFCMVWGVKFTPAPKDYCIQELPSVTVSFSRIADEVMNIIQKLVDELVSETEGFISKLAGPVVNNAETPAFNFN